MTERVIADSPSDGWFFALILNDTASAEQMPPSGTMLTGIHVIGPTTIPFITVNATVNGKAFSGKVNNGVDHIFPVNPPMSVQTGLGLKGTGWKIAGVTDSFQIFDDTGNLLVQVS